MKALKTIIWNKQNRSVRDRLHTIHRYLRTSPLLSSRGPCPQLAAVSYLHDDSNRIRVAAAVAADFRCFERVSHMNSSTYIYILLRLLLLSSLSPSLFCCAARTLRSDKTIISCARARGEKKKNDDDDEGEKIDNVANKKTC